MLEVGGITNLDDLIDIPEFHPDDQLTDPASKPLPENEFDTELRGSVFCALRKKHAGLPVELLRRFIDAPAAPPLAAKFVEDREGIVVLPEGLRLDVLNLVVEPGDLVIYAPPYYNTRTAIAVDNNLIGLVVNIEEDVGRARVLWQKYNVYKLVELAHLEILKKRE